MRRERAERAVHRGQDRAGDVRGRAARIADHLDVHQHSPCPRGAQRGPEQGRHRAGLRRPAGDRVPQGGGVPGALVPHHGVRRVEPALGDVTQQRERLEFEPGQPAPPVRQDRGRRGVLGGQPAGQRGPARADPGVHRQGGPQGGERGQDSGQDVAARLELSQARRPRALGPQDQRAVQAEDAQRRRDPEPRRLAQRDQGKQPDRAEDREVDAARGTRRPVLPADHRHGGHRDQDRRGRLAPGQALQPGPGQQPGRGREQRGPDHDRHRGLPVVPQAGQRLQQAGRRQDHRHRADQAGQPGLGGIAHHLVMAQHGGPPGAGPPTRASW